MVLVKIGQEIIKRAIRMAPYEAKMWKGLYGPSGRYPGVSNYKYAARGIQHGLAAGSVIGSLLNNDDELDGIGTIPTKFQSKTGSPYKTRSRFRRRYRSRNCKCHRSNNYSRRPRTRY